MPVELTVRRLERSAISLGAMPSLDSSNIHLGLMPNFVAFCSAATRTRTAGSGWKGEPS